MVQSNQNESLGSVPHAGKNSMVDRLENVEVFAAQGVPVRLGSLWETQSVVLVFVRHYG